jgi:type IV pilus assembly protein PilB
MDFLELLSQKGLIKKDDISSILSESEKSGIPVEQVLIKMGISPEEILRAKGDYLDIPTKVIDKSDVSFKLLELVPEESALHYKFVPLSITDGVLNVGIVDPDNIEARNALNFIASKNNLPFKLFLISESDFNNAMTNYKGLAGQVDKALNELETEIRMEEDKMKKKEDDTPFRKDENINEDAPVTKIVATILRYATDGNASDVHMEPTSENLKVRFRVDGILNTSLVLPIKVHLAVVSRIKILSKMRLDEKRKPQDGRFTARIDNRKIDFRVSTFPTFFGEKVVMRLLDQEKGVKKMDELGLSKRNLDLIRSAIKKPYGLILISGPTGSGKTSTLYSMLGELDRDHQNVLSLEDPVEYNIDGVSQSQVNADIGYTFASGLRTTLRQDPDIIMVGEIRDKETAQLAIQAALTGHLVLSTIHTNSAIGVVPRLVDMGVDPYLIAPTLILAIAQRLVSGLCGEGEKIPIDGGLKVLVENQFADLPDNFKQSLNIGNFVHEAKGTDSCPSGKKGRKAVMEVLEVDKEIQEVILKNPTENDIWKVARKKGMLTMKEDALIKAMNGEVPFEEVNTL